MAIIISHTAIINKKGQLLVLRRSDKEKVLPGYWDLPGGTVRLKENPIVGAVREAKEECGLKINDLKIIFCSSNWDKIKQEKFVTLVFLSNKYSGQLKLNFKDHEEFAWLDKKEIKKLKIVGYLKEVLKII